MEDRAARIDTDMPIRCREQKQQKQKKPQEDNKQVQNHNHHHNHHVPHNVPNHTSALTYMQQGQIDNYRRRNSLPSVGATSPTNNGLGMLTPDQMKRINGNGTPSSHDINAAISELSRANTPSVAHLAALTSPCFFHRRFGDAVNIEKVLEEIKEDDQLSHSRLMQTAASVREVSRQLQRRSTKQAVKNVMIVTKARDNSLVALTRELAEWLMTKPRYGQDMGVNVYVDSKLSQSKRFNAAGLLAKNARFESMLRYWTPGICWQSPEMFDLVITLGGDGTVLFTSWLFQRIVPPVMSFSLGSLGFLTTFQFQQYKEQLDRIMGDAGMRVTMRMRFTCTVYRAAHTKPAHSHPTASTSTTSLSSAAAAANSPSIGPAAAAASDKIEGETHEVLNELVIDRGPSSYISSLDLYVANALMTRISADGIILSTPTGSTAYSLSAGGSLVYPDIPAILLTPICPHTLSFRPMILNDSMELKVSVPAKARGGAFVSFDGKGRVELGRGDEVVVRASRYPFPTVLSQPMEWFDAISRTLRWNTRAADQKEWLGGARRRGAADGGYAEDGEEDEDEYADADEEDGDVDGFATGGGGAQHSMRKERLFDIDFDEDGGADEMLSVKDSAYSGNSSMA